MDLLKSILKHEGVATIVTEGPEGAHMVATWNSYLEVMEDKKLIIPAGMFNKTESNIKAGSKVRMIVGSKEVPGKMGPGTGVLITAKGNFLYEGTAYERVKERFSWARAAVELDIETIEQLI